MDQEDLIQAFLETYKKSEASELKDQLKALATALLILNPGHKSADEDLAELVFAIAWHITDFPD